MSHRKAIVAIVVATAAALVGCSHTATPPPPPLVTGKFIPPRPARAQDVGSFPVNVVLTPDGRHALSTDCGYYESLWSIRTADCSGVSHVDFPNDDTRPTARATSQPAIHVGEAMSPGPQTSSKSNGLYYGLAFSPDGHTVYAAQGAHNSIAVLSVFDDGALAVRGSIATKNHDFPAGLATDGRGLLYCSNNAAADGNVAPQVLQGSVAVYDPATKKELGRYTFADSHHGTSNFPLGLTALKDGSKCYVASERDDAVYVLNTSDPRHPTLVTQLNTGAHPVAVLLSGDQRTCYVANSLSDTISVVDTASDKITSTILLRPRMARDLPGVSPVSLALSPDQRTLYAACGDMNAVAVIDARSAELSGYVPTGWYPTAVSITPDGRHLLVASAKGYDVRNPTNKPDPRNPKRKLTNLSAMEGDVSLLDVPRAKDLPAYTQEVLRLNRLDTLDRPRANPLAHLGLSSGNITHVFYVIKENRTYDQVLGDMPQGNGDKSLVLFGRNVTPNQHALAERFVLLDNLYACGEVSGDGWDWSTQGMTTAYVARNIPYHYSHRGRRFDCEGQNNGYPVAGAPAVNEEGKPWKNPAFKDASPPIPDVGNTGRNIWDVARQANCSLRNYGFFSVTTQSGVGAPDGPDNYPGAPGLQPGGHDLAGVSDLDYRRFDMDYPDSEAPATYYEQTHDPACLFPTKSYGRAHAASRFTEWNREFQLMLKKDPTGAAVPNLTLIRLPTDHGVGGKSGAHTVDSYAADNDYGLGQIVQAISNSPVWPHCAIFVIEDDAQSGIDHVDAHRTTGFVISPYVKAHSVDHHFHNTDSMLKTIELLLGLEPLSQYDAVADPIMDWSDRPANAGPYAAIVPPKELIAKLNPPAHAFAKSDPRRKYAEASDRMDFTHADAAPARELDTITWHLLRGAGTPMPLAHNWNGKDDDDDD